MDERDLVEPEGVNARSGAATGAGGGAGGGDPVPGGEPERAEERERPEPVDGVLGAPPEPDESAVFGSEPAGRD